MKKLFPGMDSQAIKDLIKPVNSDYRAAIYQDRADRQKLYVVFRGTKTLSDWINANLPQSAGLGSAYYAKAMTLVQKLKASAAGNGYQLTLVGHFLGGGMADAAGVVNQVKTVSFNPSGVNANTLPNGTDLSTALQYVTDNVVAGEPLNARQDHPLLTRAELATNTAMGGSAAIPAALTAAASADLTSGGKTNYTRQTIQEIAALYSANLPAAIGRRVTLTPDPDDVTPVRPFNLHSMSSVVDAIVAHWRDLHAQYVFNECGS
jgi:hypothetical protein